MLYYPSLSLVDYAAIQAIPALCPLCLIRPSRYLVSLYNLRREGSAPPLAPMGREEEVGRKKLSPAEGK